MTSTLPTYRFEWNSTGATNAWVLGISQLGIGTILQSTPSFGARLGVSPGLISATITRGRQDELGTMQSGGATIVLSNSDGRFSPDNTASPYYGNMIPMKFVRISAQYPPGSGTWRPLFTGYIQDYLPKDISAVDSNVTISATDWLSKATGTVFDIDRPRETDVQRVNYIIGAVGSDSFPTYYSTRGTPEYVAAVTAKATDMLSQIQAVCDATQGTFFQSADGTLNYFDRFEKWINQGGFHSSYIFDQPGYGQPLSPQIVPYQVDGLDYDVTTQYLSNDIHVTGPEGESVSQDAASILRYNSTRSRSIAPSLLDVRRAKCLADSLLQAYSTSKPRVHALRIDGDASPDTAPFWDALFTLELQNYVSLVKRQPANAGISRNLFVEGVTHTIKPDKAGHVLALTLSDATQGSPAPWILGATALGTQTKLVY